MLLTEFSCQHYKRNQLLFNMTARGKSPSLLFFFLGYGTGLQNKSVCYKFQYQSIAGFLVAKIFFQVEPQ